MHFAVWSEAAERIWVCLFEAGADIEADRVELTRQPDGLHTGRIDGLAAGQLYGLRADGPYRPEVGLRFDPAKLLVDPYAAALDRPFRFDRRLCAPRLQAVDTANLVPKARVSNRADPGHPPEPIFKPGGLVYEVNVRAFTMLHPEVPEALRGTVGALAQPVILDHLTRIGVDAVELMPVTAWIDEGHLQPLGLSNAWGYNPVVFQALDPRICPGGMEELADTVRTLRDAGIGTILDVVFNHTGEGDVHGPVLSLQGLDPQAYFLHEPDGTPANYSGCGNTLNCDHPATRRLVMDSLRHFVGHAGVDGFRFDLAPILGRTERGFDADATLLRDMLADPWIGSRVLIAEPWDVGPDGYQLGGFPEPFLEWNDRYRDRIRRFWRGDPHSVGELATALAGSDDIFTGQATRSVNFIAAHDGFTLADLVAYRHKHNDANGEMNRDGHSANYSWNHGVEGKTDDPAVLAERRRDLRALLATLFVSRGSIMLTAGDEFGRTQSGNNNAYAQDNASAWLDWPNRDRDLVEWCAELAAFRRANPVLSDPDFLSGKTETDGVADVEWLTAAGHPKTVADWEHAPAGAFAMVLGRGGNGRLAALFNRTWHEVQFRLPTRDGHHWERLGGENLCLSPRKVALFVERPDTTPRSTGAPLA